MPIPPDALCADLSDPDASELGTLLLLAASVCVATGRSMLFGLSGPFVSKSS
eukprot:CAMPEP_0179470336 /NCGR_PEP_ID=MMETSP0799-20121207/50795_1 /TAXON_ID=46947 /ORGANISM="Geminigera cryophila, Strain CCMP2564" /LENGTH=51 /DNA_ID=CAMNT_0021277303 /DNA_START=350 /DNA_END=505 /DNA_ORIENTATION=-